MQTSNYLSNEVLSQFSRDELDQISPWLRKITLVAGQVLYEPGDEADCVYFPERGLISLVTSMSEGVDVENTSRGRDGAIGYVEALGSRTMVSRAVVQIAGEAWRLPAHRLREAHSRSESIRDIFHRRTEFLLAEARQSIACQAVHPAPARLARMLLECHDHTGELRFPLTQDFIADMIGVGRTTVTHAAGDLKRLGLIRYTRGSVKLIDTAGLQRHACECCRVIREMRRAILMRPVAAAEARSCSPPAYRLPDARPLNAFASP